jgi:hypothetical protein
MTQDGWAQRKVGRRVVLAALASATAMAWAAAAGAAGPDAAGPRDRESRRRWAMARMDEMAGERLRCRERFKQLPEKVRECEAEFERRHRAYNEIYIEASRDRPATP